MSTSIFKRDKTPLVLVLPGVSLSELVSIDRLWGIETGKEEVYVKPKPAKLPEEFFGLDTWATKSELRCCSCSMKYNTIPVSMPTRVIRSSSDGKIGFAVKYNYCSFPCCMRAIMNIADTSTREYTMEMLKIMFKYFFNVDLGNKAIECGPSRDDLLEYGGELSPLDYRKKINRIMTKLVGSGSITNYILDSSCD